MTTFLIYGKDSTGKSSQLKSICDASETPIIITTELKNRRLYGLDRMGKMTDDTPYDVVEPLVLESAPSFKVVPVETFNSMGRAIERILNGQGFDGKQKKYDTVVIDGISDFPRWTEQVVLQKIREKHPDQKVIGKGNLAGWAARNNLAALPIERLSAWAEVTGANVFITTLITPEYINGEKQGYKVDIQDRIRDKACDVRIALTKDGRGYFATFEKVPATSEKGKDEVLVTDGGLFVELSKRKLL